MKVLFSTKDMRKILLSGDIKGKFSMEYFIDIFSDVPIKDAPKKIIDKRRRSDEKYDLRLVDNSYGQFVFSHVSDTLVLSSSIIRSFTDSQMEPVYYAGNYIHIIVYRDGYNDWAVSRKMVVEDNKDFRDMDDKWIRKVSRETKESMNRFASIIDSRDKVRELAIKLGKV